jgi:hypothetical protein
LIGFPPEAPLLIHGSVVGLFFPPHVSCFGGPVTRLAYAKHERAASDITAMIHGLAQVVDDIRQHYGRDDEIARNAKIIADDLVLLLRAMAERCLSGWPERFDRADLGDGPAQG